MKRTPNKNQDINLFTTNPKEEKHANIISCLPTKITGTNNHWTLIFFNINELSSPIKRHRLTDQILKQDLAFCCIKETNLSDKDRHYLKIKGWEIFSKKIVPRNKLE